MSLIRTFSVHFVGHLLVEGTGKRLQAYADVEPTIRRAISKCKGGSWQIADSGDPGSDRRRVDFRGELLIDAIHADAASDRVFDLLHSGLESAMDAHSGGDWECTRVIDPKPDPRERQYSASY